MNIIWNKDEEIEKSVNEFKKTITKDPFKQYLKLKDEEIKSGKEKVEFYQNALYQGYLDACRRITCSENVKSKYKTELEKSKYVFNILKNSAIRIKSYIEENDMQNRDNFDDFHHFLCDELIADFKNTDTKYGIEITYGHAQKIINMAFKYLYCLLYKIDSDKFKDCHMPLDSFSLEWINRCYIKGNDLKKYKNFFDGSVWNKNALKKDKLVYSMKQSEKGPIGSWSTLEYGKDENLKCTYQFYVKLLRDELGEDISPLWVDFYVWPRMQMILSAEAFIKTFKDEENHTKDSDNLHNQNSQNDEYVNKYALGNLDDTVFEKLQQVKQITESAMARIGISNEYFLVEKSVK